MSQKRACSQESCLCQVDAAKAFTANGKLYCSQRCSEGRGCDHMGCSCGQFPVSVPVLKQRLRSKPVPTETSS
jgi:hypothetical protein